MNRDKIIKRRREIKSKIKKLFVERGRYSLAVLTHDGIENSISKLEKEYDKLSEKMKATKAKK